MDYTTPDLICEDGVYLGKSNSALHLPTLQALNITHILMVGLDLVAHHPDHITYKHILIDDKATERDVLLAALKDACDYIDVALAGGGSVLVHCHAGVSRSASVVIAWVMRTFGLTYVDAYTWVRKGRPIIKPNKGFQEALQSSWQHIIEARRARIL